MSASCATPRACTRVPSNCMAGELWHGTRQCEPAAGDAAPGTRLLGGPRLGSGCAVAGHLPRHAHARCRPALHIHWLQQHSPSLRLCQAAWSALWWWAAGWCKPPKVCARRGAVPWPARGSVHSAAAGRCTRHMDLPLAWQGPCPWHWAAHCPAVQRACEGPASTRTARCQVMTRELRWVPLQLAGILLSCMYAQSLLAVL